MDLSAEEKWRVRPSVFVGLFLLLGALTLAESQLDTHGYRMTVNAVSWFILLVSCCCQSIMDRARNAHPQMRHGGFYQRCGIDPTAVFPL
jgi:hypothetical protein